MWNEANGSGFTKISKYLFGPDLCLFKAVYIIIQIILNSITNLNSYWNFWEEENLSGLSFKRLVFGQPVRVCGQVRNLNLT